MMTQAIDMSKLILATSGTGRCECLLTALGSVPQLARGLKVGLRAREVEIG